MKYMNFANRIQSNEIPEILLSLIDLSPSMDENDWLPTRKDGAIKANNRLLDIKLKCHPDDKMGIIGFSKTATLLHRPACISSEIQSLRGSFSDPTGGYGTNFTAAFKLAETCLVRKVPTSSNNFFSRMLSGLFIEADSGKAKANMTDKRLKRIIMLTDGECNQGGSPLTVASRLKNAGVVIDCIGIGGTPSDVDEEILKEIASRNPDGSIRYCFIGDQEQLLQKYQTLAQHIQII